MHAVADEYGLVSIAIAMREIWEKDKGSKISSWEDFDDREAESFVRSLGWERGEEFERRVLPFGMREWEKKREFERYSNKIIIIKR